MVAPENVELYSLGANNFAEFSLDLNLITPHLIF